MLKTEMDAQLMGESNESANFRFFYFLTPQKREPRRVYLETVFGVNISQNLLNFNILI